MTAPPSFVVLTDANCRELLGRNHVGRLAFVHAGAVDIEPLGYVHSGDWLFIRSAYGAKLEALAHNPFVAFEIDEVKGPFDWRSVVAYGTVYMLPADGAPIERKALERAMRALRQVISEAFTQNDPTPTRQIVYGIHVDRLSGRMATSGPSSKKRRPAQRVKARPKRGGARDVF